MGGVVDGRLAQRALRRRCDHAGRPGRAARAPEQAAQHLVARWFPAPQAAEEDVAPAEIVPVSGRGLINYYELLDIAGLYQF